MLSQFTSGLLNRTEHTEKMHLWKCSKIQNDFTEKLFHGTVPEYYQSLKCVLKMFLKVLQVLNSERIQLKIAL